MTARRRADFRPRREGGELVFVLADGVVYQTYFSRENLELIMHFERRGRVPHARLREQVSARARS